MKKNVGYLSIKVLLFLIFISSFAIAKDDTNKNLILNYDFNSYEYDKVMDSSGNKMTGFLKDGAVIKDDKDMGKVLSLNGEGAYLELPNSLLKKINSYTISMFVNIHEFQNWARIFDIGSSTGKYIFLSPTGGGGKLIWDTNDTSKIVSVGTPSMVSLNNWFNIACTYENGVSIIYFNGNEVARTEGQEVNLKSLGDTVKNYIGKSQFGADPTINADFSDIRVYGQALKKDEIEKLSEGKVNKDIVKLENIQIDAKVGDIIKLPKTVKGTDKSGKVKEIPVFWEGIPKEKLKQDGEIVVNGKIGGTTLVSKANIHLKSMSLSKNYSINIEINGQNKKDETRDIDANFTLIKNSQNESKVEVRAEFYEGDKIFKELSQIVNLKDIENTIKLSYTVPKELKDKSYTVRAYVSEIVGNNKFAVSEVKEKNIRPLGASNEVESTDVRLALNSLYGDSQITGLQYILRLDPDRLLAPCYEAVGRKSEAKGKKYGGWESQQIAGHSLGHYISALSDFYASTGNPDVKAKLDYVISELKNIQREDGYIGGVTSKPFEMAFAGKLNVEGFSLNGYWVPWYSVHKIYAGLVDAYKIAGNQEALEILKKMADWAYNGSKNMSDDQFQKMLLCEHGGMNEVMADLYGITKDDKYLYMAKRFTQKIIIDPLSKGIDELQGLHANTQIPKIIGAARIYELTGDDYYGNAVKFFFNTVVDHRSFVIGGNSVSEHFGPSDVENLAKDSCETCNTYNMLKLAEHIFSWEKDSKYADYYEKALYNHILASQDPQTGAKTYFVSTYPGHFKVYGTEENAFWCCTGTGMENPGRYNRFVYYLENDDLYINLFIASTLEIKDKGIKLEQITNFPYEAGTTIKVVEANDKKLNIKIRVPYWINGQVTAKVGNETYVSDKKGYLTISRVWKKGEELKISTPMNLHEYVSMDNPNKVAVMYGPIVLAAALGTEKFPAKDIIPNHLSLMNWAKIDVAKIISDEKDISKWVKIVDLKTLTFAIDKSLTSDNKEITLKPFYNIHHERYSLYFEKYTNEELKSGDTKIKTRDEILADTTIDIVKTGEQQSEIEHKFDSKLSNTGYLSSIDMRWRDAKKGGFIKYTLEINSKKETALMVTYYDKDKSVAGAERIFDILVNDIKVAEVELKGTGKDKAVDFVYNLPKEVIEKAINEGNKIDVVFKSNDKTVFIGGILEVRTIAK